MNVAAPIETAVTPHRVSPVFLLALYFFQTYVRSMDR